jgi:hypothetical protein
LGAAPSFAAQAVSPASIDLAPFEPFTPFSSAAPQSVIQVGQSSSNLCLAESSVAGSALSSQACAAHGAGQTFNFVARGNGYYNIVDEASGLCLDGQGVPEVAGTGVVHNTCLSGIRSQQWMINPNADYSYSIVSFDKRHSISVVASTGPVLITNYSAGASAQEFSLSIPSYFAYMPVQSVIRSGSSCLADSGQGTTIAEQACSAHGAGQLFSFVSTGDGYFHIAGVSSGLCLDATDYLKGKIVENVCMSGVRSQEWGIKKNANGTYTLSSYLGAYSLAADASAGPVNIVASQLNAATQEFRIKLPFYITNPLVYNGGPAVVQNCPEDAAIFTAANANGFNSNLSCIQSMLGYEAIRDGGFQQGFNIVTPVQGSSASLGHLQMPPSAEAVPSAPPAWSLGQTDSKASIEPSDLTPTNDNTVLWQDTYKSIRVKPGAYVELGMKGIEEWNNLPPSSNLNKIGWPHLLLAQGLTERLPCGLNPIPASEQAQTFGLPPISHINNIYFSMTAQLREFELGAPGSTNPLHTPMFVAISNLNPLNNVKGANLGYGQGVLLNISGYSSVTSNQAPNTRGVFMPINNGAGDTTYGTGFGFWSPIAYNTFQPITYYGDIAPAIKNGLLNSIALGQLTSKNLDDYYIQALTAGWEAPLNANGMIRFSDISMRVFDSYHPMPYEFNVTGDLQGWNMAVNGSNAAPILGNFGGATFKIPAGSSRVAFTSPVLDIDASRVNRVNVRAIYNSQIAGKTPLTLSWQTTTSSGFSASQSVSITNDQWGNYVFDLSQNPLWTGNINQLQLSLEGVELTDGYFDIGHVRFSRDPVLNYLASSQTYKVGTAVLSATTNAPNQASSAFLSYSVSPALPDGLILNPATGAITGTPTTPEANGSYTVTGTSPDGSASDVLSISVSK